MPMKVRLIERKEVAERTLAVAFEPEGKFEFEAGQACDLRLLDPPYTDEKGNERTFTIASSPEDPGLLFAVRLTGSAFKRSLEEAEPGLEAEVEGPFGSFTLDPGQDRTAVFLAGGIGITPFRSMAKDAAERRLPRRITLLYSNRAASDAAFLDDFRRWEGENPRFRLIATLTKPDPAEPWTGERGRIDGDFLRRVVPEAGEACWYISGPDGFVFGMEELLAREGVPADRIRTDCFSGY